jgi:hypothetical protein
MKYSLELILSTSSLLIVFYIGFLRWVDNIKMDLREIGWDGLD